MMNDEEGRRAKWRDAELVALAAAGDGPATRTLIDDTAPMVRGIARSMARSADQRRDLVHEGILGVLHAIGRFDATKRTSFTTYARYWVRYYVQRAARRDRRIATLPRTRNMVKARHGVRRAKRELEQARGRPVSAEEIAEVLGVTADDVMHAEMEHAGTDVSLEHAPSENRGVQLESSTKDPEALLMEERGERMRRRTVRRCLDVLDPRERYIVDEHILARDKRTLREIGASLGISRERVRQLEARALSRMHEAVAPQAGELVA